jgi:hypothetical protein
MEFFEKSPQSHKGHREESLAKAQSPQREHSSRSLPYRREAAGTLKKHKKRKKISSPSIIFVHSAFSFLVFFQSAQRSGRMFSEVLRSL